jgi:sporulation protein YlmC with PRC-barrel domain
MEVSRTEREAAMLRGQRVFDASGEKVGDVNKVLFDKATRKPEWLAVQQGLLGRTSRIVPFQGVERREDGIYLPYSSSQISAAPELEGEEISQELERRLASHYGIQYSESRSQTGLAGSQKSSSRGQTRGVSGRRGMSSRRTTGSSRRFEGPTKDELYEEAKRHGIEGRSKMSKAQLERALGRAGGRSSASKGRANPFEVQSFLEAVGYPARKRELVREAKEQGADARVRSTLEQLPDEEFSTPADVSKAIAKIS